VHFSGSILKIFIINADKSSEVAIAKSTHWGVESAIAIYPLVVSKSPLVVLKQR
jgi:hypothetical protein